ncbi:glycoside hydrolase family 31 protein [Abyssalbus ytuae]|uniref:DUF4968 domain-containing protein n=1 Tax=Abyssalbus ytuae TaxID=2926907 RepID=A0A9E6ZS08_9FLAO|nr:TIM-barrel domain-containing protein [Abyssalbus ytuae]UOB17778.1 DUF4968 domain-containing protein [Abyssalbus ytuae]
MWNSKYILTIIALSGFLFSAIAQDNHSGNFEKLEENGNLFKIKASNSNIRIEFCTPEMVRIQYSSTGAFENNEPWMVRRYDWPTVRVNTLTTRDSVTFSTEKITVSVHKNPVNIDIYDHKGTLLCEESKGGSFWNENKVGIRKSLAADEHFFGFGERMDFLDQRGKKINLNVGRGLGKPYIVGAYNVLEANYCPVPFFMSTQGYGIFFHNSYPTEWDMGYSSSDYYEVTANGGELDYYFIYGPAFSKIIDKYTDLTGKSPLLPKFGLGLHVGTYSGGTWGHEENTSTQYVIDLVKKFRQHKIPLDVLHLDSTWRIFGENGEKGATTFEWRKTFDNPQKMFDSLYALNINMVGLHVRPRFDNGKKLKLLDKARKKGFVYPEENDQGDFVNFFDQKSVDWWWENGVMKIAQQGAMFLKTDEGSAFGHKANESNKTGPQGEKIKSLHNLFPVAYAKAPYKKFADYNGIRGMNHTREGYAGIQKYPFIFAGDWPSEWQYFEPVIKAGLNIGLSGVGYWTHCMGGFEHVADTELYIRWCQFGLLSPVSHLFGMEHPNYKEPWNYGEEALQIFKTYTNLRYSLIPYLYSSAYEMYFTGMPLMQALVYSHQNDKNVYGITDQYMLGKNIMVCPVVIKGAQTRIVYFPQGKWIDFWTGEIINGRQYKNVLCPLDKLPLYIKAGSIIPTQEPVQYIKKEEPGIITLNIYPSGHSSFSLYNDDGKTLDYQKGNYSETLIEVRENNMHLEIIMNKPVGNYTVDNPSYLLKIRIPEKPTEIQIKGNNNSTKKIKKENIQYEKSVLSMAITPQNEKTIISISRN